MEASPLRDQGYSPVALQMQKTTRSCSCVEHSGSDHTKVTACPCYRCSALPKSELSISLRPICRSMGRTHRVRVLKSSPQLRRAAEATQSFKTTYNESGYCFQYLCYWKVVYSTCWRKAKGIHIHDLREAPFATKCSGRSPQRTSGKNGPVPIRDKHFIDSRKQETVVRQCWIVRLIFSSLLLHQARLPDQPDAMR